MLQGELAFEHAGGPPAAGKLVAAGVALSTAEDEHSTGRAETLGASQSRGDLASDVIELQGRDVAL